MYEKANKKQERPMIQMHAYGELKGALYLDTMEFVGDVEESAKIFIDSITRHGKTYLEEITEKGKEIERLKKAAKAYQDLSTCYRLGKNPTEKLFSQLEKAKQALKEKP